MLLSSTAAVLYLITWSIIHPTLTFQHVQKCKIWWYVNFFACWYYLTPDICFQLHILQIINRSVSLINNLLCLTGWPWGIWTYRASWSCSKSITFTCSLPWKIEIATAGKGQMCDESVNGFKSLRCTNALLKSQILISLFALQTFPLCMVLSKFY